MRPDRTSPLTPPETTMTDLFHFSEDPSISVFVPHVAKTSIKKGSYVWAIDEWHAPMYLFPRDCPRACFWPDHTTSEADREQWFGGIAASMVIAIEAAWLERLRTVALYRYRFSPDAFTCIDPIAGHWVSTTTVTPLAVEPAGDLLAALAAADVELRITPRLLPLWERVTQSSLAFSGTRLRNAQQ